MNDDEDVNSYSQFLTLYHYASNAIKVGGGSLIGAAAIWGLYKGADTLSVSVPVTTVGLGILAVGIFAKKPIQDLIALNAEYVAAAKEATEDEKIKMP